MRWRKQFIFNQGSHNALKGKDKGRVRIRVLTFIFVGLALLISGRLFSLQILRGDSYTALAMGQHELYKKLFPERGSIFVVDKNDGKNTLFPVVTNQTMMMLYAVPPEIKDASSTATQLFDVLGYSKEIDEKEEKVKLFADISAELDPIMTAEIKNTRWKDFLDNLKMEEINKMILAFSNKKSLYKPIRQRLTEEQVNKIKALNIGGLYFKEEVWRFYPEKSLGGQIFGFMGYVGNDRKGVYGLEGYYNDLLTGQFGEITSEKDLFGNIIPVSWRNVDEKEDGSDIVLTIDRAIQYKACQAIGEAVKKYQAESGTVVVMDPKTGAIIAMCGAPDYDPDNYSDVKDSSIYVNKATS
ncbi:MAG: penicillin-binding transpeptidase domain-containing protein, partial [bacterium]